MTSDAPSLPVDASVLALAYQMREAEAGALRAALTACMRAFACGAAPDLPEWTLWLRLAAGDGAMAGAVIEATPGQGDGGAK